LGLFLGRAAEEAPDEVRGHALSSSRTRPPMGGRGLREVDLHFSLVIERSALQCPGLMLPASRKPGCQLVNIEP